MVSGPECSKARLTKCDGRFAYSHSKTYNNNQKTKYTNRILDNKSVFNISIWKVGGVAQLVRAHGSYPCCRGFKSPPRYHLLNSKLS